MTYKVVIPSAGLGSRVGSYTRYINKALISIGKKPAICHVIEKFQKETEILILIGYKGDQVEEVVKAFYPERKISFIKIDKFEGNGSGLGYSLLKAKEALQCPFIFIPNDTIITDDKIEMDPNTYGNWIGYYEKVQNDGYDISSYRTINLSQDGNNVAQLNAKGVLSNHIYTGLCGIKDFQKFWNLMETREDAITVGESLAIQNLENVLAFQFKGWLDCGSPTALLKAKDVLKNNEANILEKEDEAIWFTDTTVIKFSINKGFIKDRLLRLKYLPVDSFPGILNSGEYFYQYHLIEGHVLSEQLNQTLMTSLLDQCYTKMWKNTTEPTEKLLESAKFFYKQKTYNRIAHYMERFEQVEKQEQINGELIPKVSDLLFSINWDEFLERLVFSRFHGDLHCENIILKDKDFFFLDWRQNFGKGNYEYGDTYYDLGKLFHGLIVNHGIVDKNLFYVQDLNDNKINFDIHRLKSLVDAEYTLKIWCAKNGYNFNQVRLVTALIYLNICGLHEWPYARILYLLGRTILYDCIREPKM